MQRFIGRYREKNKINLKKNKQFLVMKNKTKWNRTVLVLGSFLRSIFCDSAFNFFYF
jgi:hypothetical protein